MAAMAASPRKSGAYNEIALSDPTESHDSEWIGGHISDRNSRHNVRLTTTVDDLAGDRDTELFIGDDGFPLTWDEATDAFVGHAVGCKEREVTFADVETASDHQFQQKTQRRRYARLMDAERSFLTEHETVTMALVTLTTSPFVRGGWRQPIDQLKALNSSTQAVDDALRYRTRDRDAMRLTAVGAHKSGYAHKHILCWMSGDVSESTFRPAVDVHVENLEHATQDEHGDDAVSVRTDPDTDEKGNTRAAKYAASHFVGIDGGVQDADEHEQQFATTLWAVGGRQYRPSSQLRERADKALRGRDID